MKSTIYFLLSLLIFLSLISYSPLDIPFLSYPNTKVIHNLIGIGGAYLSFALFFVFGYAAYFFSFLLLGLGLDKLELIRFSGIGKSKIVNIFAFIFFIVFLSSFMGLFPQSSAQVFKSSGIIGFYIAGFFIKYLGIYGAFITITLLVVVNALLLFGYFFVDLLKGLKILFEKLIEFFRNMKDKREDKREEKIKEKKIIVKKNLYIKEVDPEINVYKPNSISKNKNFLDKKSILEPREKVGQVLTKEQLKKKMENLENQNRENYDPLKYKLPTVDLLKRPPFVDNKDDKEDIRVNIQNLENSLLDFGVEAKVVSVQKGPVVTMYELQPQAGTKIQKISSLADDITLTMKASSVRIVAPIPGRGTIGVEIPNMVKHLVCLREVLEEKVFIKAHSKLTIVIGKNVSGNPVIADLGDMPHLLIAGATGAGKTVCVNSMICSILFKAKPDEVKFILIDPKMVELASFAGIPHLIHPIISEAKKAFFALNWAVEEMERRYKLLAEAGCRNIGAYIKVGHKMPYIVIVVDELADLMIVARENIETTIQRLAQLSRAVGIHLILATQRPSVDVITGVIKANFPARISFKVASRVDSRTVLDSMGADKLLGKGDLLFLKPGDIKLIRAQGSYIEDDDIDALTDFVRVQGCPIYEEGISKSEKKKTMHIEGDELFDEAVKIILRARQASGSMLQRRLRVGYTRAARLLDLMEQEGIVGPFCGSKAREILVEPEEFLAQKGIE